MAPVADRTETTLRARCDTMSAAGPRAEEAVSPLVSRALGRARTGDRDALGFLYARYADDVYGYARTIVSGHDEAQSLTLRVFAELERVLDRYEQRDAPFGVWLRRIARGIAAGRDHLDACSVTPIGIKVRGDMSEKE